jgi:hypothetical protein
VLVRLFRPIGVLKFPGVARYSERRHEALIEMLLNSSDIEKAESSPPNEPSLINFFVAAIKILMKVPPIKMFVSESVGGFSGKIFCCWEQDEYEKATHIAIHALKKYRNKKSRFLPFMDHHHWWSFMKHGVDSAKHIKNEGYRERLIEYANTGIEPFEGYYVAYSYLEFSRWKYNANNYDDAIKYAELATRADDTWAEPYFILGWYGLLLGAGNAEEYLCRALEKDQKLLSRIVNNDVCKQYPHIVNSLKAKYPISGAEYGSNNAKNSDN